MRFFILLCAIMAWSVPARAEGLYDPDLSLSNMENVKVELNDEVSGACWTNLKEVREYAEEKLRMKGAKVVSDRTDFPMAVVNTYNLEITAMGWRLKGLNNGCVGMIHVQLYNWEKLKGIIHQATVLQQTTLTIQPNLNRDVIETVSSAMAKLK
tara:strand:+ start:1672 stop:2133 length:462 start_codon:yes stop_codon:yes gene_type:complete